MVSYDVPVTHPDLYENLEPLEDAVTDTRDAGLQVELGGDLPGTAAAPMDGYGEIIGVVAALLILLLAFGSVVGAGLPIGVALVGLVVGSGGLTLLAATMDVSTAAPMVATMVGLGVGIDYALLLRHPARGVPPRRGTTCPRRPVGPRPPPVARWSSPPRPCWSR